MDKYFRVEVIEKTANPQRVIRMAMAQDYSEEFVYEQFSDRTLSEKKCGELVIQNLLKGGRGHYGPLEHPQIVFNIGWFPHSTMQQIRTHRVGISFDVQSGRYTSERIIDVVTGKRELEEVFYLRPAGYYTDRQGHKYFYDEEWRENDKARCLDAAKYYTQDIERGKSEEHARGLIPFDIRQHWVMSANARSLMHLLDLRFKADAQLECQEMCEKIWPHFVDWMPQITGWYEENRMKKARLAP